MITQPVIPRILSQHVEEASFLWVLRDIAIHAPHYTLKDLSSLDTRIEAHLEGLNVAGPDGWRICVEELKWAEPGEVFAASAVAFASDDVSRMQPILDAVRESPELARGMIGALGFLPRRIVMARITQLASSHSADLRFIGLSACAIHRIDPGANLTDSLTSDDVRLRARARRCVGELARRDLIPLVRQGTNDENQTARFWAIWSLGMLGERGVSDSLDEFLKDDFARWSDAVNLKARIIAPPAASAWRDRLAKSPTAMRQAIVAAGAIGDPVAIPWLMELMTDKKLTRIAGEAFTTITGADLALLKLESTPPEESVAGPNDDPDDDQTAMDPDENLPWPDANAVLKWWSQNSAKFVQGKRFLLGNVIEKESLDSALRVGKQRHRTAAALELALADPKATTPLFEVRANARAQKQELGTSAR